jgi:hypothetical protein
MLFEVERIQKIEQIKRDNEKARQVENAAYVQAQAHQRALGRQLDVNSKILERQAIERAEREYVSRVDQQMSKTRSTLLG